MGVQRDVSPLAGGETEGDSVPLKSSPDSGAPSGRPFCITSLGLPDIILSRSKLFYSLSFLDKLPDRYCQICRKGSDTDKAQCDTQL